MKNSLKSLLAPAAALAFAASLGIIPAAAAPSNPRIVGTATQASGSSASVTVTTSGAINGGDVIMIIAAGELNLRPLIANCSFCVSNSGSYGQFGAVDSAGAFGEAGQARVRTLAATAAQDVSAGGQIRVDFGGPAGAKAVTVVAISGAEAYGLMPNGGSALASGTGTAIGWSCTASCSIAANLMMVNSSVISGGGSDTYTEDAGWTFLHQTSAGAWPAIRVAYKASGAGGTFSYGLTDGASRSWLSGALLVR